MSTFFVTNCLAGNDNVSRPNALFDNRGVFPTTRKLTAGKAPRGQVLCSSEPACPERRVGRVRETHQAPCILSESQPSEESRMQRTTARPKSRRDSAAGQGTDRQAD